MPSLNIDVSRLDDGSLANSLEELHSLNALPLNIDLGWMMDH